MGNSCSIKSKKLENATISADYLKGYQEGYAAGLEIHQIKQTELDLSSSDEEDEEFTEDEEMKSNDKESSDKESEEKFEDDGGTESSDEVTNDPPDSAYLFIFSDFTNPVIFKDLEINVIQGNTEGVAGKNNIKMFYQPMGADCSDLISKLLSLDCQVVSVLDDAKPPRIVFEYQGESVSFSYLCHPKKMTC